MSRAEPGPVEGPTKNKAGPARPLCGVEPRSGGDKVGDGEANDGRDGCSHAGHRELDALEEGEGLPLPPFRDEPVGLPSRGERG